ncbi:tRNA methyltransferase complex GCD14 subunit-domain-containing protein [Neohortaea acidophila]|uniref:tRNA (adenine(58)-N(1))-methyltransferase catalytic subunit TRM61 n=1 Tax=Neohortaea acidophila TaxID=245834 RepID=A0A6A6PN46_9PEZI|nr:tRNA methyltransferase complex GCD14 subunit-domain-containing protein [Neohortaea acidophila]KAF2480677.1 tRNA methyltransferase complex GCD14 subunit-domain-containing protein [Neohortaea acidophila]
MQNGRGPTPPPRTHSHVPSPFFHTPARTQSGALAILHLRKDSLLPVTLGTDSDGGYAEGPVTNTRFGSFPHSTLIDLEWGSQVRASKVNTGSKGRLIKPTPQPRPKHALSEAAADVASSSPARAPILEAGSGFVHILPPTPEAWTSSLDHRTQVVYTPDYSYILQRLRVRPGSSIIEAGAGSGSFTHAAARAVFNGYPNPQQPKKARFGRVYSYEYHQPRVETLREEIRSHGLDPIVQLNHRDVCTGGFAVDSTDGTPPAADAIFLDLPAPWLALNHLSRSLPQSPLNANGPVHLCTFSPCIEQVMATASVLRKTGWTEVSMVEIANRRIDVRREQIGLSNEGLRGVNASPASVDEAIERLREVESKLGKVESKAARLERVRQQAEQKKLYKEGHLVHRTEPEVKTHTSYLLFAILPQAVPEDNES